MTHSKTKKRKYSSLRLIGIIVLLISVILTGCQAEGTTRNYKDIKSITISFEGNPIEPYSYTLTEEDNIKEAMRIYKTLQTYKSPEVSTWFENVTYEIVRSNGKNEKTTFKKIRAVSDIFETIFNSLEVREQAESILRLDIADVEKLELFSAKTGEKVVYKERQDIEQLMLSLKEFYRSDEVLSQHNYTLAEVTLFNKNDEYIGGGLIYRDDKQTQNVLEKHSNLSKLAVTPSAIQSMILTQGETKIEITDTNIMQVVLDHYQGYHTSESIISVEYHLKETKGMRLDWHGSFLKDAVPQEIESLFR